MRSLEARAAAHALTPRQPSAIALFSWSFPVAEPGTARVVVGGRFRG